MVTALPPSRDQPFPWMLSYIWFWVTLQPGRHTKLLVMFLGLFLSSVGSVAAHVVILGRSMSSGATVFGRMLCVKWHPHINARIQDFSTECCTGARWSMSFSSNVSGLNDVAGQNFNWNSIRKTLRIFSTTAWFINNYTTKLVSVTSFSSDLPSWISKMCVKVVFKSIMETFLRFSSNVFSRFINQSRKIQTWEFLFPAPSVVSHAGPGGYIWPLI